MFDDFTGRHSRPSTDNFVDIADSGNRRISGYGESASETKILAGTNVITFGSKDGR
jgi:hypothetical protein